MHALGSVNELSKSLITSRIFHEHMHVQVWQKSVISNLAVLMAHCSQLVYTVPSFELFSVNDSGEYVSILYF